jgi:hypothetical protein
MDLEVAVLAKLAPISNHLVDAQRNCYRYDVSVLELKEEVSRLSTAERLQAMEWLWASLSAKPEEIESPEWHGEVLAARKAKVDSGEAQFLSVEHPSERLRH